NNRTDHQHDPGGDDRWDECALTPSHRKLPLVPMRKARRDGRFRNPGPCPGNAMKVLVRAAVALPLMLCASDGARGATQPCNAGPQAAAAGNATSIDALLWSPFRR